MEKNAVRTLVVIMLCFSITLSLCGCFWGTQFPTREEKEPEVIDYVQEKYGFTPQVVDWKYYTIMNRRDHFATLSDGTEDFTVHVDDAGLITDNYESGKFDAAVTEWFNSNLPGICHAHVEESFYSMDERFEDDVLKFYSEHRVNIRITAAYTGRSFADETPMPFLSKLKNMNIQYSLIFLACPSEEAAQVVYDKDFNRGYSDIICYAPYVDESLQIKDNAVPEFHTYDVRYWDDTGYMQCLNYGAEPLPYDTYSVENSDISLSDICPTYKLKTDFINEDDGIETAIFIPVSRISEDAVIEDFLNSSQVRNMDYIYGSSSKDTHSGAFAIYGDYAVFRIKNISNDVYFSVKGNKLH